MFFCEMKLLLNPKKHKIHISHHCIYHPLPIAKEEDEDGDDNMDDFQTEEDDNPDETDGTLIKLGAEAKDFCSYKR
ncbi:hypothetical protein Bca52824_077705 [Brassica carinata]|uniref:Uncharacterized protein n=1 Tax=Brassica carinata TaxID=52824 RepID=A0A8X7U0A1_BRACI|nr:hypothetical protein Bca52824_077705 [Brassica carinata]